MERDMKEMLSLDFPGMKIPGIEGFDTLNTFAWGKLDECRGYMRLLHNKYLLTNVAEQSLGTFQSYASKVRMATGSGDIPVWIQYSHATEEYNLFFITTAKELVKCQDDTDFRQILGQNWICTGFGRFQYIESRRDSDATAKVYAMLYVPMNAGPNNSMLPVMWLHPESIKNPCKPCSLGAMFDKCFSKANIAKFVGDVKGTYPAVDLDSQASKRFSIFDCGLDSFLVYNSNHVAYNGNISNSSMCIPLLLMLYANKAVKSFYDRKIVEAIIDFINGRDVDVELVIESAEREEAGITDVAEDVKAQSNPTTKPADGFDILINAANAASV